VADVKTKKNFHRGTGRRKTAVARVRLAEGSGQIHINGRPLDNYFTEPKDRLAVVAPLDLVEMRNRLDIVATVQGGGFTGQAGALCQGVARALKQMFGLTTPAAPTGPSPAVTADGTAPPEGGAPSDDPIVTMAKRLRDSGFLTRDGRMKERKKYGRKGARKSFQFSKR
jgi:small subunit ribosomal protein S9